MSKLILLTAMLSFANSWQLNAQTIYVDPVKGTDSQTGTASAPLATLDRAITLANTFTGKGPVSIKLYPGLYTLTQKLTIQSPAGSEKMKGYSIEAVTLPNDTGWMLSKMPVIQSVSSNNSEVQFPHSVGILVAADNVSFRGLKFTGNANPAVMYYYPITKEDSLLTGLLVSQCYFAGDRYAAPIQGGVWALGPNTTIDHCLFFQCKNALLFFKGVNNFSVTNTVIYGAYEAAMWVWLLNGEFIFRNNIVADCAYFWTIPETAGAQRHFQNSLLLNVGHNAGNWKGGMVPASDTGFVFDDVRQTQTGKAGASSHKDPAKISGLPSIPEADKMGAGLFKL